jgi:hypothetical protein
MNTLATPTNRAEKEELDFGDEAIEALVGSTITAFGASEAGDMLLITRKDGRDLQFAIGVDDNNEIALYEVATETPE